MSTNRMISTFYLMKYLDIEVEEVYRMVKQPLFFLKNQDTWYLSLSSTRFLFAIILDSLKLQIPKNFGEKIVWSNW